jgi:RNA-directed DNA polymerase
MLPTPTTDLLAQVLTHENLAKAWKRVRSNKGAPGIDGLTIDNFIAHFQDHGKFLIEEIRKGNYQPYPVKRVYIKKECGGLRGLGIPTVFDRMIQQAIVQIISPIFDPTFSDFSYGFRPEHSQHQAVRQVQEYVAGGRRIAVDVDLSKFFDRVNHDLLMTQLGKKIRDKGLLKLIYKYLRAGIVENGVLNDCREGVPQGGPLSPLLSNIMLDPLDKELERRGHKFARWADDFIILVHSKRAGERVLKSITRFVERKLKLKVNDQKSRVGPTSKSKFLGFTFRGKFIAWHADAER